ncbi:MAG TPA: hypothetical protein VEQ37_18035, partial [Actinomycetota bacterium]|nr:hypothetical protein [Actinomycetota bacterium]
METKKATPKDVSRNGFQTVRPGECVVLAETDILIGAPWLNDGWLSNRGLGVRAGVPTIVPRYAFSARSDGASQLEAGKVKILGDATEGVLAPIVDVSDGVQKQMWRDGKVAGPNRRQLIEHWRGIVGDWSLAEVIVNCIQAGLDPDTAARELCGVYEDSFLTHRARLQPWLARSQQMILAYRA